MLPFWFPLVLHVQIIDEGRQDASHKIMVFCQTARMAEFLGALFVAAGVPGTMQIHSKMTQSKRTQVSNKFRKAQGGVVLFTSDVSARGVDYPNTSLIVQVRVRLTLQRSVL